MRSPSPCFRGAFCCATLLAAFLLGVPLFAQPVPAIRNKISAGDFYSAESILEQHRREKGADGLYLQSLGWLARGAVLLGEWDAAGAYAGTARRLAEERIAQIGGTDSAVISLLGAALEVEAQVIQKKSGPAKATVALRDWIRRYDSADPALLSRLYKRLNLIELAGRPAPEIDVTDSLATAMPTLRELRGAPVVLFFWAEWCGDCLAQAQALAAAYRRFEPRGVKFLALTRYYKEADVVERSRIAEKWAAGYRGLEPIPVAVSTASMIRYGVSSTPTFAFVDRKGIVTRYSPTRLTEQRLNEEIERIAK